MSSDKNILITTIHGDQLLKIAVKTESLTFDEIRYWREPENLEKIKALIPAHCLGGGIVEIEDIFDVVAKPSKASLQSHIPRIFEMLNCYEVDARTIEKGVTYLDSTDAQRLARNIIHSIEENW